MRFKHHLQLEQGKNQIVIIPLLNMLFLLLAFLLLVTKFIIQPGIGISLPKGITSEAISNKNTEIILAKENTFYLNGKLATAQELRRYLELVAKNKQPIMIKADKQSPLSRVVEIWDMCRELGITQLNVATNQ